MNDDHFQSDFVIRCDGCGDELYHSRSKEIDGKLYCPDCSEFAGAAYCEMLEYAAYCLVGFVLVGVMVIAIVRHLCHAAEIPQPHLSVRVAVHPMPIPDEYDIPGAYAEKYGHVQYAKGDQ